MSENSLGLRFAVVVSLLLAMMLRIVPMCRGCEYYNPDWVLLFLIYWTMTAPEKVGVVHAWCAGLFVDVLTGRMLGQHALAYAVIAYLCVKWHRRLRLYPVYQQAIAVSPLLLLNQLLILWTQTRKPPAAVEMAYWLPSLTGALAWPLVLWTLRNLQSICRIS